MIMLEKYPEFASIKNQNEFCRNTFLWLRQNEASVVNEEYNPGSEAQCLSCVALLCVTCTMTTGTKY